MHISKLLGRRTAETPKDAQSPSHQLLVRGGYIRQMGQGIFTLLPLAQRVRAKIEAIVREEMDAIGGQEIQMPVVTPAELWMESGRYQAIGLELVRFADRTDHPHVLNMTNEETVVDVVRSNVDSYRQLPFMVYQVQTKFRDELRSRAGLIRVREFTMKDGYSFHRTAADLAEYYEQCHGAYQRIFARCGLTQVVDTESDNGMMGGSISHEFMLLSPFGEDSLLLCGECGYRANREVARCIRPAGVGKIEELLDVETPQKKTIEEVAQFLDTEPNKTLKAVLFMADGAPIAAFVRGDLEVNQAKLRGVLEAKELRPMQEEEVQQHGIVAGFVGPVGLPDTVRVCMDDSASVYPSLVVGANRSDVHTKGFNLQRDLPGVETVDISEVQAGDACPTCQAPLRMERGIEIGNIFQLGTKYTSAMNLTFSDEDGSEKNAEMGCYGIGIGRTLACIIEEHHDDKGPRWPITVAPYEVQVCCLQGKKPGVVDAGHKLYKELKKLGLSVILDDREVGIGFMFADADLIGAPVRLVVSPRNLKNGVVELKYRGAGTSDIVPDSVPLATAANDVAELVKELSNGLSAENRLS